MNRPSCNPCSTWSFRRVFGVGGLLVLVCLVTAGTLYYIFGRGDSDRRDLPDAPEFVAKKVAAAEAPATFGKNVSSTKAGSVLPIKVTPEEVAPYGLPLNVVFENVPATPEKLTKATPLSAIPDLPEGYIDDLVREHEELEKQKQ